MSMSNHISHLTSTCFGVLRQIRCIRRRLFSRARTMLVTCFIFARLDYCNAMFMGLPRYDLDRLQAIQNAAVRLIAGARKFDLVIPLLRERHWLPVEQRITFTKAVMTYKYVHSTTADYLEDYIQPPSSATANLHLRSSSSGRLFVPRSKTAAGDRFFAVAGPRLWNSLPTSITSAGSLTIKKTIEDFFT